MIVFVVSDHVIRMNGLIRDHCRLTWDHTRKRYAPGEWRVRRRISIPSLEILVCSELNRLHIFEATVVVAGREDLLIDTRPIVLCRCCPVHGAGKCKQRSGEGGEIYHLEFT